MTPFNVLNLATAATVLGTGTTTPLPLAEWWTRYITKPGDTILDPFAGSGTMGIAALNHGRNFIGIEKMEKYAKIAAQRIGEQTDADVLNQDKPIQLADSSI